MELHPEKRTLSGTRKSDRITQTLKEAILEGRLKPGDKLPTEEQIASQFKVSKVAVREALREMETQGLILKQRGLFGGSYVAEPDLDKIGESVIRCYQFGALSLEALAEFRQILEPALIELAAGRRTEEDLHDLGESIEGCEAALKRGTPDLEKQVAFHVLIARACHNPLIVAVMEAVAKVFEDIAIKLDLSVEDYREDLDYSREFYDCILHGHHIKARRLMFEHFEETKRWIKRPRRREAAGDEKPLDRETI